MNKQEGIEIKSFNFKDDGHIPNNPNYSLLLYENVLNSQDDIKEIFSQNDWYGAWNGTVATYHHYHSNTHEVLAVVSGWENLQLGGEKGVEVKVTKGDVIVLPAGTGHKLIDKSPEFGVVGTYPDGIKYDFCYGKEEERPEKIENIQNVPVPDTDPLFGTSGPLFSFWRR